MPTIEEITAKYIELRDRKADMSKRHGEEARPLNVAMEGIEAWMLNQMNTLGVDSFKTSAGTPYKANSNSVKMTDAGAFKGHVFAPALDGIYNYLSATGHTLLQADKEAMQTFLLENTAWDMIDFRAGKKGVIEYLENNNALPPGIAVETSTVVNVRRS